MRKSLFLFFLNVTTVLCLQSLVGTQIDKCITCICHAVTFCEHIDKCAEKSISKTYWDKAGSPVIDNSAPSEENYRACMKDRNCILNTIYAYTDILERDANCDDRFTCKDRLALHLKGHGPDYALETYYVVRYDRCTRKHNITGYDEFEGWEPCQTDFYKNILLDNF